MCLLLATVGLFATGCPQTGPGSGGAGSSTFQKSETPTVSINKVSEKYAGKKVAVFPFVNKSLSDYRWLGDASSDYLLEFLQDAGFRTVEGRTTSGMGRIIGEAADSNKAVASAKHLGTEYVFLGSVTDFNVVKGKGSRGLSFGGFAVGGAGGSITYTVQSGGRFIDVRTREILASSTSTFTKKFEVKGGRLRTPWGAVNQDEQVHVRNETGGRILQMALNELMNKLVRRLNSQ
jgi:curli biogenesis system outer membrane secretion channel CsgG